MRSLAFCVVVLSACGGGDSSPTDAPIAIDAARDAAPDAPPPDPCAGVTCECTVATQATDCAAHEFCNATSTSRTCECVAGYSSSVNGCTWTGSIVDPGFTTTTAWQATNTTINTTAAGNFEAGEAQFTPANLCALGTAKQTAMMPTFANAQPLVLALNYKNQIDFGAFDRVLMGVSFGGTNWTALPFFSDASYHNLRVCVPEGGFAPATATGAGGPITFAFGPYIEPDRCPTSTVTNFAIDHAEIVPAMTNECGTTFGQGANFNAEGAGGWTFATTGASSGGFAAGIGVNSSKAARLTLGQRCDSARMDTTLNIPDVPHPALDMFVGVSAGANAFMQFGGVFNMNVFDSIPAGATSTTFHMCLPPALRGQSLSLAFTLNGGSGLCSDTLNQQVFADNAQVVNDPTCATVANLANPGFENVGRVFGSSGTVSSSTAVAIVRATGGEAHGGTQFLSLEASGRCATASYNAFPIVPSPNGAAGPALKFFAKVGANANAQTTVSTKGATLQTLTEGGGYLPYTVCLKPNHVGRPISVLINHSGGSGLCDNSNYTLQTAQLDDFEVTTDASCPAQ